MEEAARRYARRILALHLLALLLIIGIVALVARQVYQRTREQLIDMSVQDQERLAVQTAHGIRGAYESILANLDMIRRNEEDSPEPETAQGPRGRHWRWRRSWRGSLGAACR